MCIIDWKVLKTMVPYSRQHIKRLEKDGKFPQRVELSPNRVGWILEEVQEWIESKAQRRYTV